MPPQKNRGFARLLEFLIDHTVDRACRLSRSKKTILVEARADKKNASVRVTGLAMRGECFSKTHCCRYLATDGGSWSLHSLHDAKLRS